MITLPLQNLPHQRPDSALVLHHQNRLQRRLRLSRHLRNHRRSHHLRGSQRPLRLQLGLAHHRQVQTKAGPLALFHFNAQIAVALPQNLISRIQTHLDLAHMLIRVQPRFQHPLPRLAAHRRARLLERQPHISPGLQAAFNTNFFSPQNISGPNPQTPRAAHLQCRMPRQTQQRLFDLRAIYLCLRQSLRHFHLELHLAQSLLKFRPRLRHQRRDTRNLRHCHRSSRIRLHLRRQRIQPLRRTQDLAHILMQRVVRRQRVLQLFTVPGHDHQQIVQVVRQLRAQPLQRLALVRNQLLLLKLPPLANIRSKPVELYRLTLLIPLHADTLANLEFPSPGIPC